MENAINIENDIGNNISNLPDEENSKIKQGSSEKKKKIIVLIIVVLISIVVVIAVSVFVLLDSSGETAIHGTKLASEQQMLLYASSNYGDASILNSELDESETSITFNMKDSEYGFEYECVSTETEFCIDGSCGGWYYEKKSCDFEKRYEDFIRKKIMPEYDGEDYDYPYDALLWFSFDSAKEALSNGEKIAKKVRNLDSRGFLKDRNEIIKLYVNDEYYGQCAIYGQCEDQYEAYSNQMRYKAAGVFGCNVAGADCSVDDISYLYYKRVPYKDVEGLKLDWLVYKKGDFTENDLATLYYFDFEGKTYFVMDEEVRIPADTAHYNPESRYPKDGYFSDYLYED